MTYPLFSHPVARKDVPTMRSLIVVALLVAACGGAPDAPDAPTSASPAATAPNSPAATAPDAGAAVLATCTDGPQFVSYSDAAPSSAPPTSPAFRYPSGACRITWGMHLDTDVNCGGGPAWHTFAFINARGDGQVHYDEWDRAWPVSGVITCS